MEQKIYTSSFRTGPNATKKQQMLFATDTAYALSEGYKFIKDSTGVLFEIIDAHNLLEVDDCEECNCCEGCNEPKEVSFDPDADGGPVLTDEQAIDRIISSTLHQYTPITADQAKSMFYLAQTKLLMQMNSL